MRNIESSITSEREHAPRLESWLLMCLISLIPGVLIVILPRERLVPLLVPIIGSMVVLLTLGLIMLWRTERAHRRQEEQEAGEQHGAVDDLDLRRLEA